MLIEYIVKIRYDITRILKFSIWSTYYTWIFLFQLCNDIEVKNKIRVLKWRNQQILMFPKTP